MVAPHHRRVGRQAVLLWVGPTGVPCRASAPKRVRDIDRAWELLLPDIRSFAGGDVRVADVRAGPKGCSLAA